MSDHFKLLFFLLSILVIFPVKKSTAQEGTEKGTYFNKTKVNALTSGNTYGGEGGFNFSTIHGLNFSEKFAAGIGAGVSGGNKYPSTIIPIFVNGTYFPGDFRQLYLSADLGYSLAAEEMIKGGLLGEISIGFMLKVGRYSLAPELGYRYDAFKSRILVLEQVGDNMVLRRSDNYFSNDIKSFSAGISLFF